MPKTKFTSDKVKDMNKTLKRTWGYLKKYKLQLILVFVFIVLSILFSTISSFMLSPIIDDYIVPMIENPKNNDYFNGLITQLIYLICSAILGSIFTYFQYKTMAKVASYTVKDMRQDLFDKIEKLPVRFFDKHEHGELMSRITNDLDNVTMALNTCLDNIVSSILNIIIALIVMFTIDKKLTIISFVTIPVVIFVSKIITDHTKKQYVVQQKCLGELNGFIDEYISGQKVIKAFNREDETLEKFDKYNKTLRKEGFKAQAYGGVIMPVMGSIANLSNAVTYVLAGLFAIKGKISIGSIVAFTKFASQYTYPITEMSQQIPTIQQALAGAERMFEIIDEEVEFADSLNKEALNDVKGLVEFKHVSFGYDKKEILHDINIKATPGQTIALVGPTGAGKTTIINLLTRFYDVTKGKITIDGNNIKDVNFYSLRENLGIVLQDTVLFSNTIMENIRYGKLDATDEEVISAAKIANAHTFIEKLPDKYNTVLNEGSSNISVGQRQLLNIARVILNNPKIIILDEATSNVDTRTEVKIQEAMESLMKGRTSFVIAHRLSTIKNADKILVINDGKIVEEGKHEELLNKKGMYYEMYTGMFSEEE